MRRFVGPGFQKAFTGLGMVGVLLLMGSAPTPQAPLSEGVQVPVVLDGVRYEPEEFNRIHADLRRRGVALCYTFSRDGTFHAFSAREACDEFFWKEWGQPRGLPFKSSNPPSTWVPFRVRIEGNWVWVEPLGEPDASPPPSSRDSEEIASLQLCPPPDPYWSLNWEHILCQGSGLAVLPQAMLADLRQISGPCAGNWNDCISSAQAASGIYQLILWEHINFQGEYLRIPGGWTAPDLRAFNWNDRASSLYAQP